MGPMLAIGASVAGFSYLAYQIRSMRSNKAAFMAEGHTYMSPLVQQRLSKTFGWFSYGVFSTSAILYAMRNSTFWMFVPWPALVFGPLAGMYAIHAIDYERNMPLKALAYTAFTGMIGISILPLIQMSAAAAVADAALITGLSMSSLSAIAYCAPSEQFLNWGGALTIGCTAMFAAGIASMFFPASRALHNIWLWGGLGLTSCLTLYNTQAIVYSAKTQMHFDPLGSSIGIYMNAVNFFVRILMIMQNRKK